MLRSFNTAPAIGIAYSIWLRARWTVLGIGFYLLCLAIVAQLFPESREPVLLAALLLTTAITHLLQVFTLGPSDLGIRASGFPKHMFVLPLPTRTLVGWPMLIGATTHAGLWILVAMLVFIPAGFAAPVVWPAVIAAAATAWVQAIGWSPFPTPFARVPALALAMTPLILFGAWVGLFFESRVVSFVVMAGSLLWTALAYLFAVHGLSRARRGDDGNWNRTAERFREAVARPLRLRDRRVRRAFRASAAAQLWHEWRRNACFLPVMIGLIGVPLLALTCQSILNPNSQRTWLFGSVAVTPAVLSFLMWIGLLLLLANLMGPSVAKFDLWGKEEMPSFFAIRPMSTSRFVALKMIAAAMSALGSVAILLLMLSVWAVIEISPLNPRESIVRAVFAVLTWRKVGVAVVALLCLWAITWRCIAIGMWHSLTGRKWVNVVLAVFFTVALTIGIIVGSWIYRRPELRPDFLTALPWLLGFLIGAKVCAAVATIRVVRKLRLIERRTLAIALTGWIAIVVVVLAGLSYFSPINWMMAAGAILFVPFSQLAIAPAALHWNRHR